MSTINERRPPLQPVRVEFYWTTVGEVVPFLVNGITYPYKHEADEEPPNPTKGGRTLDTRYKVLTTNVHSGIIFDAVDSESLGHPRVTPPEDVYIVEYLWKFGDGSEATGEVVSHDYIVVDPFTKVTLIVTDSRGFRWSTSKSLNLVSAAEARIVSNKILV